MVPAIILPERLPRFRKRYLFLYKVLIKTNQPIRRRDGSQVNFEIYTIGGDEIPWLQSLQDVSECLSDMSEGIPDFNPCEVRIIKTISKTYHMRATVLEDCYRWL